MTLRRSQIFGSLAAALAVAALGTLVVDGLRSRDRAQQLEQASAASVVQHVRESCEANPNWFLAGPRDDRPSKDQLTQPDADVYTARPDAKARPFEFFAYDEEFKGISTAAPRFPDSLRIALKSGSEFATESYSGPQGSGLQTARWTRWRSSECAVFLFRAAAPAHLLLERTLVFAGFFGATFAVCFLVGLPTERRAAALAAAMRNMARADYVGAAPADGQDELTAIGATFNEAAAGIRTRAAEIKDQQDALRRVANDVHDDLVMPLGHVPTRIGEVLRSVSVTPAVRDQMSAALRDAHTLEHRGANFVASLRLRDREAAFQEVPVDFTDLVTRVVSREVAFATACGISLSATVPDRTVNVVGDPGLFALVLENLIDNAIRYSKPGASVTVDLDTPSAGKFVLLVADEGAGVNDATLKYFNGIRRFRGDERRNRRADEVGLGLAIVHEVTGRAKIGLAFRRRDKGGLEVKLSN